MLRSSFLIITPESPATISEEFEAMSWEFRLTVMEFMASISEFVLTRGARSFSSLLTTTARDLMLSSISKALSLT